MSQSHDKRAMIKLTPQNQQAVDHQAKVETKRSGISVSRAAMANLAVALGIRVINHKAK